VPSLARPGGNVTGITVDVGYQTGINGKRLQILKEAIPSASKVAVLTMRTAWEGADGDRFREAGPQLAISLTGMLLEESSPSEYQRVFAEIAQHQPDAIIVSGVSELFPFRHLIVELAEKNGLPGMYPYRDYAEAGGLMAYGTDLAELWRRMADDLHQVLNGTKPGDIPIYQPTKFEFLINLKAAKAIGLTIPSALLAVADEVIE
jgi:putative ABC transport system substrate-binding protein